MSCANATPKAASDFSEKFERAAADGAKTILLVENADWSKAFREDYRSQLSGNALIASMLAWSDRYNIHN